MLREDFPGVRLLNLRRRRSRLPWMYLVYQEGLRAKGSGSKGRLNPRSLSPQPLALSPLERERAPIPRDGETPGHRRRTARRDRCLPRLPAVSAPAGPVWLLRGRGSGGGQSTTGRDPLTGLPPAPSDETCNVEAPPASDSPSPPAGWPPVRSRWRSR